MAILDSLPSRGSAFLAGVALHLFVFRHGEWDNDTTKIIRTWVTTPLAGAVAAKIFLSEEYDSIFLATKDVSILACCAVAGLYASLLLYRAAFHRLNKFPGPFAARLSTLYVTSLSAKKFHLYEEVERLHRKHGDYVRLAPSELSIADPRAIAALHGHQSQCTKGPWYNVLYPIVSLHLVRDKPEHVQRRKVWDRGFSAKALRDYEPRVKKYTEQLLSQFDRRLDRPLNAAKWFNFYSFDVMGDLAWGISLNMLKSGKQHYFMATLHEAMAGIGLFSHLLWLFPIFKVTPILNRSEKAFWAWIREQMTPDRPDVFSWLLAEHQSKPNTSAQDELNLLGDAYLIAVAGSDTTAAALTCLFYQLAQSPESLAKLQAEIDAAFDVSETLDSIALGKLEYLNAVINETLRLHPPVPSGVQRVSPPQGMQIGETWIPGNCIVQVPTHTTCRDERCFVEPDAFIPERWTTREELIKDSSVFVPFSTGRYSCIGKQLALMEVRYVTANLLRKYNFQFAPDQSPQVFLDGKKDTFTLALGSLNLVFSARQLGDTDL